MKLTRLSALALAAALAVPLGITAGKALASVQGRTTHAVAVQGTASAQKSEVERNDNEKADAESLKEPKEAVDRDNLQQGPGNTSDNEKVDADSSKEPKEAVDRDNLQDGPGNTGDGGP
ncbi:MAG: hypothetical protein NVS1B14_03590 [Vulcanimicrobiaceae bacterium]